MAWTSPPRELDGAGGDRGRVKTDVGETSAAILYQGHAHVFYSMVARSGSLRLRHAVLDGPDSSFRTLDGQGSTNGRTTDDVGSGTISTAVFDGQLHVFYRDATTLDLRHAWFDGVEWRRETLDGDRTDGGRVDADVGAESAATVYGGALEVFYSDETQGDLRRATFDGAGWTFSVLDGDGSAIDRTEHEIRGEIATGAWGGALHVLYGECDPAYACELGWLRDAAFDGSSWTISRAFRMSTVGRELDLMVAADDDVIVVYHATDQLCDTSVYCDYWLWRRWDGSSWSEATVGSSTDRPVAGVVVNGAPILASAYGWPSYTTWGGAGPTTVTPEQFIYGYSPTSAVVVGGIHAWFFWVHTNYRHTDRIAVTKGP